MTAAVLSDRALNRATLARQALLEPSTESATALIERLAGLQAQDVTTPYVTLWTRLVGFARADLQDRLADGSVLRVPLWRNTVHHVTAADFQRFYGLSRTGGNYRTKPVRELADRHPVVAAARALIATEAPTAAELEAALGARFPEADAIVAQRAARAYLPYRHLPPLGFWRTHGAPRIGLVDADDDRHERATFVLRYLAAFGPASVADAQRCAGVTRLGPVFAELDLVRFRSERGVELFDLPDAPRPDPDTPAPVRFLGVFDNALIGYADRARIIRSGYGAVRGAGSEAPVLIDGFADGFWTARRREPLTVHAPETDAVRAAAERLAAFLEVDAVSFVRPGAR